ncbi:hypothetical protein E2542_SST26204 [Spatholobus suberectus]|nr:hypothetical protein E2542_SST26204 [Spatholobus suberectus]
MRSDRSEARRLRRSNGGSTEVVDAWGLMRSVWLESPVETMSLSVVFVFVYYNGQITNTIHEGATFLSEDTRSFRIERGIKLGALKATVQNKVTSRTGKTVTNLNYRCLISIVGDRLNYKASKLHDDADVETMFSIFDQYPNLRCIELLATKENNQVESSSNPQPLQDEDPNADIMNKIMEEKFRGYSDHP